MKKLYRLFKEDKRNIITFIITFLTFYAVMLFPNSIPRLLKSVFDFFTSFIYYVFMLVGGNSPIPATVTQRDTWSIFPEIWNPIRLFPESLSEFFEFWGRYLGQVFTKTQLFAYLNFLNNFIFYASRILLIALPLIVVIILRLNMVKNKRCIIRGKKSRALIYFEKIYKSIICEAVGKIRSFCGFVLEDPRLLKTWIIVWCIYFNVFSILISALAYYFYFTASWNVFTLYGQVIKFQRDLTPVIRFVPRLIWIGLALWIYNRVCRSIAFQRLYYAERCNRAFLRERGIVSVVFGAMGTGKTQLITSMARSSEVEMFDQAYQIMLEKDIMFPNFPWQVFRDELKLQIKKGNVVDLDSCEAWARSLEKRFKFVAKRFTCKKYQDILKKYKGLPDRTFGYDYDYYPLTYNDELKISTLFDALVSYAQAYMLFTVETTLLFSNYSIRVDSIIEDLGNFPTRNNDFFSREPKLIEAHAKHSHIIDFDMLRLGRKLQHTLKLSYGVFVITEIDKERKNALELKEYKIKDDETNQKNDLFNACLMMCRHAAVVDNRVFIRIICDLQRPEAWGAGGRELGEVIYIADKGDLEPVLPFFSLYWIFQGAFELIKGKYNQFKATYDVNRCDETLTMYLMKNVVSKIDNYFVKQNGLFGKQMLHLEIQSGNLEGEIKKEKWRMLTKKDRSNVYRTDCLNQVFESYEPNTMHVDDFITYAGSLATQEELAMQNSYFQNDIRKMKGVK